MPRSALAALVLAAALCCGPAAAFTQIVLLGTAGGPDFNATRAQPAQALYVDGIVYLVDCGNGVGEQLRRANLPLRFLRHIFVTHHHSDHVADLFTLLLRGWGSFEEPITLHGPKPLKKSVEGAFQQFRSDIKTRTADETRPPLRGLVVVHQFQGDGLVHQDEHVTVTAARVDHVGMREAYAYRFDTPDLSVVFSGDTAPSQALVQLATGADILVHEVLTWSPEEAVAAIGLPLEHPLVQHILNSHTSHRDVGRIAAEASVGTLVLTHFVPADGPLDQSAVLAEIEKTFTGTVVFGTDLMALP